MTIKKDRVSYQDIVGYVVAHSSPQRIDSGILLQKDISIANAHQLLRSIGEDAEACIEFAFERSANKKLEGR